MLPFVCLRKIFLCGLWLWLCLSLPGRDEPLFPEQNYINKYSVPFFKMIDLNQPAMTRVNFFVKTHTYRSAYINLSETIIKNPFLQIILPVFNQQNLLLIDTFNRTYKNSLTIENYKATASALNVSDLTFLLLLINTIYNDYRENRLSGDNAFKTWNIIVIITEQTARKKTGSIESAAILKLSAVFTFFKKSPSWQKKNQKWMNRFSNTEPITHPDILLVLKQNP